MQNDARRSPVARILCAPGAKALPFDYVRHAVVGVAYVEQRATVSEMGIVRATGPPVLLASRVDDVDHFGHTSYCAWTKHYIARFPWNP